MRKKQLAQQNTALFAEIERKAGEIEALQIRAEELQAERDAANAQKERLEARFVALQEDYHILKEQEVQLAEALRAALFITSQADLTNESPLPDDLPTETEEPPVADPIAESAAEEVPYTEELPLNEPEAQDTEAEPPVEDEAYQPAPVLGSEAPSAPEPTAPPVSERGSRPDLDLLRAHGADLIGRLTRQTATLIAALAERTDPDAESVKTLILGKNESFKYQILNLMHTGEDTATVQENMNRLAEETAAYLTAAFERSR